MYKKIKNSSFMNLIWFIICALPLVLLIIYALGFFNNEDLRANEQDNYTINLNSISGGTLKEEQNTLNNYIDTTISTNNYIKTNKGTYTINNSNDMSISLNNTMLYNWFTTETTELYLYMQPNEKNQNTIISIKFNYLDNNNISKATEIVYKQFNNSTNYDFYILKLRETINNKINNLNDYSSIHYFNNNYIKTIQTNNENDTFIWLTNNNLYLNQEWYNNYINYVNDFNTIKYNSCPISYTYNNNTYNIETNNNNYLGTSETIEINQEFNYTLNEEPTLNYNNYFISNAIEHTETIYGADVGEDIDNNNNEYQMLNCETNNIQYNNNYTYYLDAGDNTYQNYTDLLDSEVYYEYRNLIFIVVLTNTTYEYEYYNIESTINTSLELIPSNNFNDFLTNIENTIKTNGFISNAFLNLSTFFGVTNVYYSLACYYIEYLLVIALLHLAFDILYMLPNICHKFMEKLGGERD